MRVHNVHHNADATAVSKAVAEVDGVSDVVTKQVYASKKECEYAKKLDMLTSARGAERILRWTPQCAIALTVNGVHVANYMADFYVEYADGRREYHETKGYWTPESKLKMRLFQALYPEKKVVIV